MVSPLFQQVTQILSPIYTLAFVCLLPLVRSFQLKDPKKSILLSWIAMIVIGLLDYYVFPALDNYFFNAFHDIPDTMPGMGLFILFGWIPGLVCLPLGVVCRFVWLGLKTLWFAKRNMSSS